MFRLGIVDCDTSHVVQFSRRLNHRGIDEEQWVDGATIVAAWSGPSAVTEQARIDGFVQTLRDEGVPLVDRPEDLLGQVDGVLIESNDGSVHRERAVPFLEAGLPVWIDKPFTTSVADAVALVELAQRRGVPIFSASSLRYGLEVQRLQEQVAETGRILGADVYSPAALHPRNPGLFHYGVHGVEILYALLGTGCRAVRCVFQEGAEVVTGVWADGRIGTLRGTRAGAHAYGFTAFGEWRVVPSQVDARYIYRELLKQIMQMFETGRSPLAAKEMIEGVAFQEAALRSREGDGAAVALAVGGA
ncbi:MAG TPA: Gfo/Idh/MocA family oxidoreductase [Chloroflexota bacterium]